MSAFSRSYELNGEDDCVSLDDVYEFVEQNINADEIYTSLFIKNYNGKNIEVKITDIEKNEEWKSKFEEYKNCKESFKRDVINPLKEMLEGNSD